MALTVLTVNETKWGRIASLDLGGLIAGDMEPIQFDKSMPGKPHTHDRNEIAVCTGGSGRVFIDEDGEVTACLVTFGMSIEIPAGCPHWMEPHPGVVLTFLILYRPNK